MTSQSCLLLLAYSFPTCLFCLNLLGKFILMSVCCVFAELEIKNGICRKVYKFSEARKLCCNLSKIQTKRPNHRVFCQKDAIGMANSEDPDQEQSDLGLHCLPRPICPKT